MKDTRLGFTFMAGNFIWRRRGGPEGPIILGLSGRQTVPGVSALFIGRFEQMGSWRQSTGEIAY
jgi:hypothetical protein